jgi:hypothetical protein
VLLLPQVFAFILGRGALTLPLTFVQFTAVLLAPFMPAELAASKVNSSSTTAAAAAAHGASLTSSTQTAAAAEGGRDGSPSAASVIVNPFMLKGGTHAGVLCMAYACACG